MVAFMTQSKSKLQLTGLPECDRLIDELVKAADISAQADQFREMLATVVGLALDKPGTGDIRQFNKTMKELRHALAVFAPYRGIRKISVFGSARTPSSRPEFQAAREFSRLMMESGYMIITGGGDGIMGAGQAGAGRERSFALNIKLPFEQAPNEVIQGDPKLINFSYFFTRKVTFVKNSHAIALFPGGFGTMDEGFEALTLIQTGKAPIIPLVFIDAPKGNFWHTFERYLREHLLLDKLISPEDFHLFKITRDIEEARAEVLTFYKNFHSYRYVRDQLVLRMHRAIPDEARRQLRDDFADIITAGELIACPALREEINEPELAQMPRLCLSFNRHNHGRLRQLIDRINEF